MKYLLDEKEYNALKDAIDDEKQKNKRVIQKLCTMVCNNMPVKFWGHSEAKIWGCIIKEEFGSYDCYCDECPVQKECPYEWKNYSK